MIAGWSVLGLVCVLLAGVSFVYVAAPVDLVRDRLIDEVKARTGRDLMVAGPVSMSLFPRPGVTIDAVTLSAPPEQGGTLLTVDRIAAEIGLGELLARRVQIRRLVLTAPKVNLRVDASGRRNWDFAGLPVLASPVRYAQLRGPVTRDVPLALPAGVDVTRLREALAQVLPAELTIAQGVLSYRNARTGEEMDATAVDLEVAAQALSAPVVAKGSFTLRGQPMAYTATLGSLDAALASGSADLVVKAQGAPLAADFDGKLALRGTGPEIDGSLTLNSPSIPALGAWLGRPVAMNGPTDLSFAGRVEAADGRVTLGNFQSVLAGRPAHGTLSVDFNPARPKLQGQLQVAALDLGAILLRNAAAAAPATPTSAPKADPIGDILRQQQPPPQQPPSQTSALPRKGPGRDWNDERLDTRLLGLIDADLRIAAGQILHRELKTGPSRVAITLVDRNLRVDLEDISLYGGRGRGVATVDAAAAVPALSLNLNLDGVSAGPFLKDAADFEWLDGRTTIAVAIAGQGYSEREVVQTLSGTVEVKTLNGHLSGLSLPKLIQTLERGQIPNMQVQATEKTPFSEFAGTFVIAKGVAQNNDLRLYTENARVTGAGTVQLPTRHLAYDVRAKVSGSGGGQAGTVVSFSNIEIPLRVEGPWDKPVVGLKGQEQLLDGLKNIGRNLKNPDVQDALRGLLGGNSEGRVKPRELLDRLLKKE